ncbi:ferritin-like domain-containing protein [Haliscomenobacter hydrossis]|uniref:Uncharacterized protein n=1 Tax=Haliscomenobacter hydrossis (strain ATCC 27775 / DSM 1100 / LMG 10767 / O) TaxID=760192 RepID=F4KVS2_HALH1|nr:ferritin-like domain-containing protein [Haliscomenobacter hydrossis]AEE53497.1 protein of unknown function DUF892 [Haliscomenobacter hydrossis DSM 1100]
MHNSEKGVAHGLRALLVNELKDIYWAEQALVKAIPKMIKHASAVELIEALTMHHKVTEEHVSRLEAVFSSLGEKPESKKCEAIAGLIMEAEGIMEKTEAGMVRDAGIILATQKIEHYEIATYGTLRTFARTLGEQKATALLQETLDQEKEVDVKLTQIAESFVNEEAVTGVA